jgi:outer membrane protein W
MLSHRRGIIPLSCRISAIFGKMMIFGPAVVVVITLAGVPQMFAQSYSSGPQYEVSGFGGASAVEEFQVPTVVSINSQQVIQNVGVHYATGYQIGVRLTENVNDSWDATLEYSYANQPVTFTNLSSNLSTDLSPVIQSLRLSHSVNHLNYSVSYLALGHSSCFRPYVQAGVGATLFFITESSRNTALALGVPLRDSWKFTFNWGGGAKYVLNEETVLIFDVKDYISSIPSYGLPLAGQVVNGQLQTARSSAGRLNSVQLNIGIAYRWNDW